MSVKDQGPCKVILSTAVLSSAMKDSRNILHWHIYIIKENHVVVPHPLIWIKTGLMKLFWVYFDFVSFWQWGTISSLHMSLFTLFNYSTYKPWVYFVSFAVGQRYSHVSTLRGPNAGGDAALKLSWGLHCSFSKGSSRPFGCWGAGQERFSWGWESPWLGALMAEDSTF